MNIIDFLEILELGLKLRKFEYKPNQLEIIAESLELKYDEKIKLNSIKIESIINS